MSKVTACAARPGVGGGGGRAAGNGEAALSPNKARAACRPAGGAPSCARAWATGPETKEGVRAGQRGGGRRPCPARGLTQPPPPFASLCTLSPGCAPASNSASGRSPPPPLTLSPRCPPSPSLPCPRLLSPLRCRAQRFGPRSRWPQSASSTTAVTGPGAGAGAAEGQTGGSALSTVPAMGILAPKLRRMSRRCGAPATLALAGALTGPPPNGACAGSVCVLSVMACCPGLRKCHVSQGRTPGTDRAGRQFRPAPTECDHQSASESSRQRRIRGTGR